MLGQGLLGSTDGALPFSVICDTQQQPASRTGLGYVQSDAQVQYQAINEKFIVNMEGGQTVQVQRQTLPDTARLARGIRGSTQCPATISRSGATASWW